MQQCVSQTQQTFIIFFIVLGQHVSILIESSSGPSKKIQVDSYDPYDSIRIETCCSNTIKKHNKGLLCLTDTSLYILCTFRDGKHY